MIKFFTGLLIFSLMVFVISSGCTSPEKSTDSEPQILNDASTVFPESSLSNIPENSLDEQDMRSLIIGNWKIQMGDQQIQYWQFQDNGNLTGGSEPGSHEISGTWSTFGFENLYTINAAGINRTGDMVGYDIAIATDLTNRTITVVNPDEYTNWQFIRL